MTDRALTFTAAVGVIAGVHDGTSDGRSDTHVSDLTGFTDTDDLVIEVTDLSDGRLAFHGNVSHFAARHFKSRHIALFCHEPSRHAGSSCDLSAFTGLKFDVVDHGTDGDRFERKRVANLDVGVRTGNDHVAYA